MERVFLINVFVTVCLFSDVNARPSKPNCPPDKPTVYCFVDPCDESSCAVKGSSCQSNSCGGCNAIWSDSSGTHLNDYQCTTTPRTTPTTTPNPSPTTTPSTTPKPSPTTTPKPSPTTTPTTTPKPSPTTTPSTTDTPAKYVLSNPKSTTSNERLQNQLFITNDQTVDNTILKVSVLSQSLLRRLQLT